MTTKKTITLTPELEIVISEKKINFNAYVNRLIKEDMLAIAKPSKNDLEIRPIENKDSEYILKEITIANSNLERLFNYCEEIKDENIEIKSQYVSIEKAITSLLKMNTDTAKLLLDNTKNINRLCSVLTNLQKK